MHRCVRVHSAICHPCPPPFTRGGGSRSAEVNSCPCEQRFRGVRSFAGKSPPLRPDDPQHCFRGSKRAPLHTRGRRGGGSAGIGDEQGCFRQSHTQTRKPCRRVFAFRSRRAATIPAYPRSPHVASFLTDLASRRNHWPSPPSPRSLCILAHVVSGGRRTREAEFTLTFDRVFDARNAPRKPCTM